METEAARKSRRPQSAREAKLVELKTALPQVTGIRHWSTPDYTRVAIDLEAEVKYEAGRVPNPDRIFFDLHGTKLSSALVGKSFDVSDSFLRKIRVAQYQRDMTRVVLEVDDVSDYSAFLLPNPYRLIIDIHGRKPSTATTMAKVNVPPIPTATEPAKATEPGTRKPTIETEPAARTAKIDTTKSDLQAGATGKRTNPSGSGTGITPESASGTVPKSAIEHRRQATGSAGRAQSWQSRPAKRQDFRPQIRRRSRRR